MRKICGFLLLIFNLCVCVKSFAQTGGVSPRSLRLDPPSMSWQILGPSCQAYSDTVDGLPCHPAFLARELPGQVRGALRLSDNIKYWDEVQKLIQGTADRNTVQSLFHQAEDSSFATSMELDYFRKNWGVGVTPYRLGFFSRIQNPALPLIQTVAFQEQNIRSQIGSYLQGPWSWGLETRAFRRQIINQEFFLTDVLVEGGPARFQPQTQTGLYLEPGLLYEFENTKWNPKLTLMVTQFGFVDQKVDDFTASPELTFAGSVQPGINLGKLQMAMAVHYYSQIESAADLFQGSVMYQLGFAQYLLGISNLRQAFGYNLSYHGFQAGLEYANERNLNRVVTIQAGCEF